MSKILQVICPLRYAFCSARPIRSLIQLAINRLFYHYLWIYGSFQSEGIPAEIQTMV